jgi:hypothetical protein
MTTINLTSPLDYLPADVMTRLRYNVEHRQATPEQYAVLCAMIDWQGLKAHVEGFDNDLEPVVMGLTFTTYERAMGYVVSQYLKLLEKFVKVFGLL